MQQHNQPLPDLTTAQHYQQATGVCVAKGLRLAAPDNPYTPVGQRAQPALILTP